MSTYVVGDVQGCFSCLEKLLDQVNFDPASDRLLAAGDLVNRGPESLKTLRFCQNLGDSFQTVLGNHDLHLLAIARNGKTPNKKDTFDDILTAPDRDAIFDWLQQQPLLLRVNEYTLVHAGIPPQWSVAEAEGYAQEVENVLRSEQQSTAFFQGMYGNVPDTWDDNLKSIDRLRCITNYLTRMRYCDLQGRLNLENKLPPDRGPAGFYPWFNIPSRKTKNDKILFGHWASLQGETAEENVIALDRGCVWGGQLRMMCLDTLDLHELRCSA